MECGYGAVDSCVGFHEILQFNYSFRPFQNFFQSRLLLLLFIEFVTDDQQHDGEHHVHIERAMLANDELVDEKLACGQGKMTGSESEPKVFIALIQLSLSVSRLQIKLLDMIG